jgi:hypothetical protein
LVIVRKKALYPAKTPHLPVEAVETSVPYLRSPRGRRLAGIEARLVASIDGKRTIAELAQLAGVTPREALHIIAPLVYEHVLGVFGARSISGTRRKVEIPIPNEDEIEDLLRDSLEPPSPTATSSTPSSQPRPTLPVIAPLKK